MCVETLRTVLIFLRRSIWGVSCLDLVEKWTFSHLCPWNTRNVCWNPSEQYSFFQDDWFEVVTCKGLTLKMNVFPFISMRKPINVCWKPSEQCSYFWDDRYEGVSCIDLVEKWMFSHLCPWKHYKCVLRPSEQGLFFWIQSIRWVTCLGFLWKWMCFHPSPKETPSICVDIFTTVLFFLRQSIWVVTCLGLLWRNECFLTHVPGNTINVCWDPQNSAYISETIDLRCHMPRFTLKRNFYRPMSLETL